LITYKDCPECGARKIYESVSLCEVCEVSEGYEKRLEQLRALLDLANAMRDAAAKEREEWEATAEKAIDASVKCERCEFIEEEYVKAESEDLTRDALILALATLRVERNDLREQLKKIENLSKNAWEQVDRNAGEASKLFKLVHARSKGRKACPGCCHSDGIELSSDRSWFCHRCGEEGEYND
jgi:SpoVK/Ycf46/Vps4 family AAA+-type ATPase